jgi:hypothetical protein
MMRVRAARLLTAAVVVQLLSAVLVPASLGLAFCRFGAQMAVHDCCAGRAQRESAGRRIDTESCCSVQGGDHAAPPAERGGQPEQARPFTAISTWHAPLDGGSAPPLTGAPRPADRALGPPIRLLTHSFLL